MKQIRQGDVYLRAIESLPAGVAKLPDTIVARGEATGHNHVLIGEACTLFGVDNNMYAVVESPAVLTHPEHAAIQVATGIYEVVHQREYTPQEIRRVQD